MFNDDEPEPSAPTLESAIQALGGEVDSTRTTPAGYFRPIFLAFFVIAGSGILIYHSYTYGSLNSPIDQAYRQQQFKLALIGGPLLLCVIYWWWCKLRRSIYLCAGGLVEVTSSEIRSIPWHRVSQLETAEVYRQFLKGAIGKLLAIKDRAYVITYIDSNTGRDAAIVIESWAFEDATRFYSAVYAAAEQQMESVGKNNISKGT